MKKGIIFDLDGVIVDTAKYHYLAWKKLANQLGFEFTEEQNELKSISLFSKFLKLFINFCSKSCDIPEL
jgi:beta-phosphoglucomutase-like phosphatase (HAD superfamily)